MQNYEQKGKNKEINYKKVAPKKYGAGIAVVWIISILISAVLGFLTYLFVSNPEYVPDGNYNVLSTASWLKIILVPLCILIVLLIASIITARIKLAKIAYVKRYKEWVEAERAKNQERMRKLAQAQEPIILPEQEELEEEDDDVENRRVFFEQSELPDLEETFSDYCKQNGLDVSSKLVSEIFSAIACSRLIIVRGLDGFGMQNLVELLSGFFLGNSYVDKINKDGELDKSGKEFFEWIKSCKKQGRLHFACVNCQNFDAFTENYGEFIPSLVSPEKINSYETFEKYGCSERFVFPQSVWCLVGVNETIVMPKEIVKSAIILNLVKTEFASEEFSSLKIEPISEIPTSFLRFSGMIGEETGRNSLSLDAWKKIDHIEQYLAIANEDYFDNKICRQIERYIGFEMCGGLREIEALDKMLANKILPFMVSIPKENFGENHESISEFLDRIFALQNLPLCEIYLTQVATARERLDIEELHQTQAEPIIEEVSATQESQDVSKAQPVQTIKKVAERKASHDDEGDGEELSDD